MGMKNKIILSKKPDLAQARFIDMATRFYMYCINPHKTVILEKKERHYAFAQNIYRIIWSQELDYEQKISKFQHYVKTSADPELKKIFRLLVNEGF